MRVAAWTHLPVVNQEDLQILRYGSGQTYKPHMDVLEKDTEGRRKATVIIYLSGGCCTNLCGAPLHFLFFFLHIG